MSSHLPGTGFRAIVWGKRSSHQETSVGFVAKLAFEYARGIL